MLGVIMLGVIRLSVIMLSVMAPRKVKCDKTFFMQVTFMKQKARVLLLLESLYQVYCAAMK
jgi:hypothetical protein